MEDALIEGGLRIPVDVRVLNFAPLSFRYSVIRAGVPIFVRDDDARVDFEVLTLAKYFDFEPFRRMYLREIFHIGIQRR
ncbi:MAG: hypothetical protein ACUVXI_12495 [bacterium]